MSDIAALSEQLARDPASFVFLELADALRKRGDLDVAVKVATRGLERHPHLPAGHDVLARCHADNGDLEKAFDEWDMVLRLAPGHAGALKGLGFVRFQQGALVEAERYLAQAADADPEDQRNLGALAYVRQQLATPPGGTVAVAGPGVAAAAVTTATGVPAPSAFEARKLFHDILGQEDGMALLLDEHGLVLAGGREAPDGRDIGQEVGAQLGGVSEEATRAMRHLGLGAWTSIVFETEQATVAMAPGAERSLMLVSASRATPVGFVRRMLDRSVQRAGAFLGGGE
jgi:tetratricopeptide (TPR) repeat protein